MSESCRRPDDRLLNANRVQACAARTTNSGQGRPGGEESGHGRAPAAVWVDRGATALRVDR
jgi:hypothetical protein